MADIGQAGQGRLAWTATGDHVQTKGDMADIGQAGGRPLAWPPTGDHLQTKGDRRRWLTLVRLVRVDWLGLPPVIISRPRRIGGGSEEVADIGQADQGRPAWPATGDHLQTKGDL